MGVSVAVRLLLIGDCTTFLLIWSVVLRHEDGRRTTLLCLDQLLLFFTRGDDASWFATFGCIELKVGDIGEVSIHGPVLIYDLDFEPSWFLLFLVLSQHP